MTGLIRITRGPHEGMTARVVNITADTIRARLTATGRLVKLPRDAGGFIDVDETPVTAQEARERMSA